MAGTSASIDIEYTEELVCAAGVTLIRRSDLSGNLTFIGSNGAVVAAPAAYTIGACVSATTDLEAVDFCMRANTAGVGYVIGDQIKLTRWFNPTTNVQVSEVAFNTTQGGSAVTTPLVAANFDECTVAQISLTVETYRLSGGAVGASTASTAPASVPVVGNTLTINGPYRSLSWRWLRQTSQDPGTGLVAKLIVNGFEYYPGSGPQYQEVGQSLQTSENQTFSTIYTFTASGAAFVELVVVR